MLMSRVLYQEPLLTLALVPWIRGRDVVEIEIEIAPSFSRTPTL